MTKLIVRGGCVLSMNPAIGNRREADVLVEDGLVTEVGTNLRSRGADEIDASEAVVLPGFVDAHRHTGEALAQHAPDRTRADYSSDDVYAATLTGLLSAAESGVTTVADWCAFAGDDHTTAALQAHADAGLRTVLVTTDPDGQSDRWRHHVRSIGAPPPLTSLAADPPAPDDWSTARELGRRIHLHAGTGAATPSALARNGLLGPDVTLTHCSGLGADEFDALAESGATVVLTPTSDMAGGAPPVPVQELIDRAIRPGVGTGALAMASGDVFAQLRTVIALQHAMYFDLKLAGKAGLPRMLTTRDVIAYATTDGARAIGLADVTGSITPGRPADIVVLRTDRPNIMPVNDPIGAVVWGMDSSNVDTVLVAGRALVRDGSLTADLSRVRSLIAQAQQRVGSRRTTTAGEPP